MILYASTVQSQNVLGRSASEKRLNHCLMGLMTVLLQCSSEPRTSWWLLSVCPISTREKPICLWATWWHQRVTISLTQAWKRISVLKWICSFFQSSLLPKNRNRLYFRDRPSTSINTNTQDISEHSMSTSMSSKYHRSPPQSIFKSWHFPLWILQQNSEIRLRDSRRLSDDHRCVHAWLTISALSGVRFDFPLAH